MDKICPKTRTELKSWKTVRLFFWAKKLFNDLDFSYIEFIIDFNLIDLYFESDKAKAFQTNAEL